MKSVLKLFSLLVIAGTMALMIPGYAPAHGRESEDKTLSPYFFLRSDDPTLDRLPLKSTLAVVSIAGVIADVQVTQVYKNEGQRPIEAVYTFPASTRAAVYGMKMSIGKGAYAPMSMALKEAKPEMSRSEDRAQTSRRPVGKPGIVLVDLKAVTWTGDRPAEEYLTKNERWQGYLKEVEDCYHNFLKKHPGVLGKITVALAIGPNGQVQKASIAASDLQHPTLEACIIQKVKSWNFPVLAGKGTMTLTVPLVFKP